MLTFMYRQIYGGIGLGVAASAVITMFALSNVSVSPVKGRKFSAPILIGYGTSFLFFSDRTFGFG